MATTAQLTATVEDSGGSTIPGASTYWTSEDPSIATVDQTGLVTAVSEGTTTIHAISGQASATKTVTVTTAAVPPNPTLGAIDPVTAVQGDAALSVTVGGLDIPSDATLVFSATGITVDDLTVAGDGTGITGHITLADDADVGSGTVKIHSATTGDSATLPFAVTAEAQTLDHITMTLSASPVVETATAPTLTLGQYQTSGTSTPYTDTLSPANAFTSSNPSVASINATTGAITLHGPGTTSITRTAGGKTVTASLTVTAEVLSATPPSLSVIVGAGPSSALVIKDQDNVDVTSAGTFASTNPSIATVSSSGVVTYVGVGTCDIVFTHTVDSETCTIGVTVSAAVEGLIADPDTFTGVPGDTQQESFTLSGDDVDDDVIAYSSDPSVVTITSAPEQPTVDDAENATSTTLDIPVTSQTGGGTPETVALEVDEAGDGTWVRQTAIAWTGNVTATQAVTATGLTVSTDYTGKIRAVTITPAGDSYPSAAIPSGTTTAAPAMGTLPVTRGLVGRLHAAAGVTLNGSNVAQIVDQIAGTVHAQATAGFQPPLTLNAYGTKPCIAFADGKWLVTVDGTGTPINAPALNPTGGVGTVIIIGQLRSAAGVNSFIISSHDSATPTKGYAFAGNDSNGRRAWYYGDGGSPPPVRIEEGSGADLLLHMHTMVTDTTNPTKQAIYRDGTSVGSSGSVTVTNTTKPSYLNTNANNVGAAGTGCSYNFCERLVFNVALTSAERASIRTYAQTAWGSP